MARCLRASAKSLKELLHCPSETEVVEDLPPWLSCSKLLTKDDYRWLAVCQRFGSQVTKGMRLSYPGVSPEQHRGRLVGARIVP